MTMRQLLTPSVTTACKTSPNLLDLMPPVALQPLPQVMDKFGPVAKSLGWRMPPAGPPLAGTPLRGSGLPIAGSPLRSCTSTSSTPARAKAE